MNSFIRKISQNNILASIVIGAVGLLFSLLVVMLFLKLTMTYAALVVAALCFVFAIPIVGDLKRMLWALLVIFMPISVDITLNMMPGHTGGAAGYQVSSFDIVLAALYFIWIFELLTQKDQKVKLFPSMSFPAFLLILITWVSLAFAYIPELTKYEAIEIVKMYLTFLYIANNLKTRKDIHFIIILFIIMLVFEGFVGVLQRRWGEPIIPAVLGGPTWVASRIKGSWTSTNDFSWYLTFFIPLTISMLFAKIDRLYKLFIFCGMVIGCASLMWTSSRAGWLSMIVSVLFIGVFVVSKIREKRTYIRIFFFAVSMALLVSPLYPRLFTKVYGRFMGDDGGSAQSRYPHMQVAFRIIGAHPIIGIGLNNYTEVMWEYDNTDKGLAEYSRYPVHNIYLHLTAEIGIIGLFCFLYYLFAIYKKGFNYIFNNDDEFAFVVMGLLSGILAFLFHGIFDTASLGAKLFLFVWFFTGMIFAIGNIRDGEKNL